MKVLKSSINTSLKALFYFKNTILNMIYNNIKKYYLVNISLLSSDKFSLKL